MRAVFLPREAQRVVPWRNGGGSTREVAIEPPDGSVATGFRWRISIAGVAADGPFSAFPGVDRSLWLLSGGGMEIDVADRRVRLERPYQRVDFAGEAAVSARLLAGPTTDLNVMVARGWVEVDAGVFELAAGATRRERLPEAVHVVCTLAGSVEVDGRRLAPGDALRLDGSGAVEVVAVERAAWLRASFVPVQR